MTPRALFSVLFLVGGLAGWTQTNTDAPARPQEDLQEYKDLYSAPAADAYQGAWESGSAQRTADLWKALCESRPLDANAQLNWYRSERNARLSRNNGRLGADDKAALDGIADHIGTIAPGSFEAHLANYYTSFPTPEAFTELEQAAALAPTRQELIVPQLTRAMRDGDERAMDTWSAELEKRGGLAHPLMDAASDLLLSVAKDGILFTNGDMDTQPALVRQRVHDDRRDILLIDQRLLADAAYRRRVWKAAGAAGNVPAAGTAFAQALTGATARPVFLALGLDRSWLDAFPGRLHATGAALRVCQGLPDGIAVLEKNWAAMKKPMDAGPLSRNYVLPAAVLLEHYRAVADEQKAARLEGELRRIAEATGATQDLYRTGVLQH